MNYTFLEKKAAGKALGEDGFNIDFLKIVRYDKVLMMAVANFFNSMLDKGKIPTQWKKSLMTMIYKGKGDITESKNYRGIALASHFYKLF